MLKNNLNISVIFKKFIIIFIFLSILIILQYLLFFFGKSVYLSIFLLLITLLSLLIFKNINKETILIIGGILLVLTPLLLLFNRDFSNYFGMNLISWCLFYFIVLTNKGAICYISRKKRLMKIIMFILLIIFLILSFLTNIKDTHQVILKIKNPERYYAKINKFTYKDNVYHNDVIIEIDNPKQDTSVSGLFSVEGWAAEMCDLKGSGIESIYFFLGEKPHNGGKFLGKNFHWIRREDVQDLYGDKYKDSGFYFEMNSKLLDNGPNQIYVYAKSNYFGWNYKVLNIVIQNQ